MIFANSIITVFGRKKAISRFDMFVIFYRLNPKPDPRYEKLFQETEAYESKSINPNDLRHNLMKRKYDDDEDSYDAR